MSGRWSRAVLFALPISTVVVIAFALFVVGAPAPILAARVYGGPTDGAPVLSWRVQLVQEQAGLIVPAGGDRVRVRAQLPDGQVVEGRARVDAGGDARLRLAVRRPVAGPLVVGVDDGAGQVLAQGSVRLEHARWLARAERRGGFLRGSRSGSLQVRVAPGRGVLAVPFADPVLVEVRAAGKPLAGAQLSVSSEGGTVVPSRATSDADGRALLQVRPERFVVALRVHAEHGEQHGSWYATLPVEKGALHASLDGNRLRIRSPIERDTAFFSIVSERARLFGGSVPLEPDGRGGAVGIARLPKLGADSVWAVVSSEPGLDSPAAVGWPLRAIQAGSEPASTLTIADVLLLDGLVLGRAREAERRRRARWLAGLYSAGALGLVALTLALSVRRSGRELREHLEREGVSASGGGGRAALWLLVAIACIALGFAVVALVAMYDIGK